MTRYFGDMRQKYIGRIQTQLISGNCWLCMCGKSLMTLFRRLPHYSSSCLCLWKLASCFFAFLVTVHMYVRVWHTMYVQCTMCGAVFHLMPTIDNALLWLFKQSPLNTHNTASPSCNKVLRGGYASPTFIGCAFTKMTDKRVVRHTMTLTKGGFCVSPYKHG